MNPTMNIGFPSQHPTLFPAGLLGLAAVAAAGILVGRRGRLTEETAVGHEIATRATRVKATAAGRVYSARYAALQPNS